MIYILGRGLYEAQDYAKTQTWLKKEDWRYLPLGRLEMLYGVQNITVWQLPNQRLPDKDREFILSRRAHLVQMPEVRRYP